MGCREMWQVGSRDQKVNKEQMHELCLHLSYRRLVKKASVSESGSYADYDH